VCSINSVAAVKAQPLLLSEGELDDDHDLEVKQYGLRAVSYEKLDMR